MPKFFSSGNVASVNGALFWAMEVARPEASAHEPMIFTAGYPITPVNDVTEYLSALSRDPQISFIQAESEIAAANMVLGAASLGVPAMTVTSSPGMSLMQEAISYAAGMELGGRGLVYVDVVRGGPGLGNIQGSQADFNQAVFGGGHGDYQTLVLAPSSAQEMFDFTRAAFKLSALYRIPGFILSDGYVGQLKEMYEVPDKVSYRPLPVSQDIRTSIYVREGVLEKHNWKLYRRFEALKKDKALNALETVSYRLQDAQGPAEMVLVTYGFFSRIGTGIVDRARERGIPLGQLSLKSLNPFPEKALLKALEQWGPLYVMEGSIDQLGGRIRSAVGSLPLIGSCQRPGGVLPDEKEVVSHIESLLPHVRNKKFQESFKAYVKLISQSREPQIHRGDTFDSIALGETTFDVEYKTGMIGKRPEARPIESMTDKNIYFCSGCDHKHSVEILGKTFDKLKDLDIILYSPVGCAIFMYDFFKKERIQHIQVPHGRGPAAASASKRCQPDALVICYQGDGDALDIGLNELLHAATRGEPITVILINNGTYGMTGGQLSSATPLGQCSKTTPKGRDPKRNGYPIDLASQLHRVGVSFYRRTLLGTPEWNKTFTGYLAQALAHQMQGTGMSVIEVLATCVEHQKASQEIIRSFEAKGKKLSAITLSREYASTVMPKTFPLHAAWGESVGGLETVTAMAQKQKQAVPAKAAAAYPAYIERASQLGMILDTVQGGDLQKDFSFYLCGEGGQGIQSMADILVKTGVTEYAYLSPWYEPEVTKARTAAMITLSQHVNRDPVPVPGEVDVLVCMTERSFADKKHFLKKGGLALIDGAMDFSSEDRVQYTLLQVPATTLVMAHLKEKRTANMFLLGVLSEALGFFKEGLLEKTILRTVTKSLETNLEAFRLGKNYFLTEVKSPAKR